MPKSEKELRTRDAKRNLGKELLQSVREMKAGRRGRVHKVKVSPTGNKADASRLEQPKHSFLLQHVALMYCEPWRRDTSCCDVFGK